MDKILFLPKKPLSNVELERVFKTISILRIRLGSKRDTLAPPRHPFECGNQNPVTLELTWDDLDVLAKKRKGKVLFQLLWTVASRPNSDYLQPEIN